MKEEELQKIPTATITKALANSQLHCGVCFDKFHFNETEVRKLPCDHLYHTKCIFPWLQRNASCPYCRAKLPNSETSDFRDAVLTTTTIMSNINASLSSIGAGLSSIRADLSSFQVSFHSIIHQLEQATVERRQRRPQEEGNSSTRSNQTITSTAIASAHPSLLPDVQTIVSELYAAEREIGTRRKISRRTAAVRARNAIAGIYRR